MNEKITVVWLCHFSNPKVHSMLELGYGRALKIIRKLAHKSVSTEVPEFANWITNGIKEFEQIEDVELHIVSPYPMLKTKIQEFTDNGIHYHFFKNEDDSIFRLFYKKCFHTKYYRYRNNCKLIANLIDRIHPAVVHLFGAENPYYALGLFSIPDNIVSIAQLQTLMNDPDFLKYYPIDRTEYQYRANVEISIIHKANFIGTTASKYRNIINNMLKPDAIILNTTLPLMETIVREECKKSYDFVYFASNINKAADLAIEAFGLAYQKNSNISLDVVGGYDSSFKEEVDKIIEKYNIRDAVRFEGKLPTHEAVLNQIRKSRFALLPLKIDLTSGTIREAMSNGIPVITTDTGQLGTQKLNFIRKNVLISPIGDHHALADNMLKLMENVDLAENLRQNAFLTSSEISSNKIVALKYVEAYKACLAYLENQEPLPYDLTRI